MNDHGCLGPTTDQIRAEIADGNPALVELADRFANTADLAAWFRSLPQRDDDGIPGDGPKVEACRPAQRLRFDATDPNCFERSARFVGAAELIDPDHVYRLATVQTPNGLHTFPTCDGDPVVLDPKGTRNTPRVAPSADDNAARRLRIERLIGTDETKGVRGDLGRARRAKELGHTTWVHGEPIDDAIAMYEKALARYQATIAELDAVDDDGGSARNGSCSRPMVLTPTQAIDWIADLARERVEAMPKMLRHVNRGHRAMRAALLMLPICVGDAQSVALVLALAEREARSYGLPALKVVHSTARALDSIERLSSEQATRNLNPLASLALGVLNDKDLQSWLGAVTRVGGRILGGAGVEVLKSQLASVGVSQPVLSAFEKELNREGLTLGALSKPSPMPGSLDAMTPQALAGRWIAQKL
ncbi:MAG: hypothetical protein QM831_21410 [Kofleriaceae bacterium]